eukprot:45063-Eustigmatos_ZCMA.PRE.1
MGGYFFGDAEYGRQAIKHARHSHTHAQDGSEGFVYVSCQQSSTNTCTWARLGHGRPSHPSCTSGATSSTASTGNTSSLSTRQ